MAKAKKRRVGDVFRPVSKVLTERSGVPTRIEFGGNQYFMVNPEQDKKDYVNNSRARRRRLRELKKGGGSNG